MKTPIMLLAALLLAVGTCAHAQEDETGDFACELCKAHKQNECRTFICPNSSDIDCQETCAKKAINEQCDEHCPYF